MYLSLRVAAAIIALSVILIPWNISNFSFNPRRIETVSSTVGSSTIIGWKRLSNAASFSIFFLYSSIVVAPITFISPLANIGFNKFPASIEPSVLPAPTIVWISSIKRIIRPSLFSSSVKTAFNLSSNSPLYLAPAISAPISREKIVLSFKFSGTSPCNIRCARPSAIAVLPTPGSPIRTGLFFVRLDNICIARLISESLPITGSILPFLANSTKSRPYFSNTSYDDSGVEELTFLSPLISFNASTNLDFETPFFSSKSETSKIDKNKCSVLIYESPCFFICSSDFINTLLTSLLGRSWSVDETFENELILSVIICVSCCTLTPILFNIFGISPSFWSINASIRCSIFISEFLYWVANPLASEIASILFSVKLLFIINTSFIKFILY